MPRHTVLGLTIELPWSLALPETSAPADLTVTLGAPEEVGPVDPWPSVTRIGAALELAFSETCRVLLPESGRQALCFPDPRVPIEEPMRMVVDHVIPRLLSRRHGLVLHASAVRLGEVAVGFVGKSGQGKSSLAFALALDGAPVLADDALVLDRVAGEVLARPLWPSMRIRFEDLPPGVSGQAFRASPEKAGLGPGDHPALTFQLEPVPLRALYVLREADTLSCELLGPREALLELLLQSYHLEADDLRGIARLMSRVEELGLTHRTYTLGYPRDFERLPELKQFVRSHVAQLPASTLP